MRVLILLCVTAMCTAAFGQAPAGPRYQYGYGPFVPLVTTPQVSLQTVSPNPVGASNATYGLVAGARNSTLSIVNGNTSSVYTEPVWYAGGGAPLISEPEVSIHPRPVHGGHMMMHPEDHAQHAETARGQWQYISSFEASSPVEAAASAKSGHKAGRTITNDDINQENQKTGTVKYDGKTEKIQ